MIIQSSFRVSNLWTIINLDNECRRRKFLGGSGGMLSPNILKIGSLKTPFSILSGQNVWQNGTEIAVSLCVPFIIYHKITLSIPFKLFFWSMTSLQLRCFSKLGHFASQLRSSQDLGFSVKIGTVPPKSGRLDALQFIYCKMKKNSPS